MSWQLCRRLVSVALYKLDEVDWIVNCMRVMTGALVFGAVVLSLCLLVGIFRACGAVYLIVGMFSIPLFWWIGKKFGID